MLNVIDTVDILVLVAECKVLYKSMRDALRYQQKKKTVAKSGDSGGEDAADDELSREDCELKDALSFLTPTSSKFPRKTTVIGAGTSSLSSTVDSPILDDEERDAQVFDCDDSSMASSTYSYVSALFSFKSQISIYLIAGISFLFYLGVEETKDF